MMAGHSGKPPGQRVQLHRALSKLGWGSRTQAWDWIRAGEVQVDGQVVTNPLAWVDLDHQRITRAGQEALQAPSLTLALHKPRGIVTTRQDERGRRTVYDLLPPDLPWIFPAGRLDADSEGLLILTNDSALALRLTDPEHHLSKTYQVLVTPRPAPGALEHLRRGVILPDGRTRPAGVRLLEERPGAALVEMVLTEGRNRQIRRMWASQGHRVRRLVRVAIGGYLLGDLAPGTYRQLDAADLRRLTGL
ncbi:MAG: rRNA pseudouridine synthase [Planctomycetes bacterium]|nr:rRNA pseudouridine synthase [Planctomycetota bacterium]